MLGLLRRWARLQRAGQSPAGAGGTLRGRKLLCRPGTDSQASNFDEFTSLESVLTSMLPAPTSRGGEWSDLDAAEAQLRAEQQVLTASSDRLNTWTTRITAEWKAAHDRGRKEVETGEKRAADAWSKHRNWRGVLAKVEEQYETKRQLLETFTNDFKAQKHAELGRQLEQGAPPTRRSQPSKEPTSSNQPALPLPQPEQLQPSNPIAQGRAALRIHQYRAHDPCGLSAPYAMEDDGIEVDWDACEEAPADNFGPTYLTRLGRPGVSASRIHPQPTSNLAPASSAHGGVASNFSRGSRGTISPPMTTAAGARQMNSTAFGLSPFGPSPGDLSSWRSQTPVEAPKLHPRRPSP